MASEIVRADLREILRKEKTGERKPGTADACIVSAIEVTPEGFARLEKEMWEKISDGIFPAEVADSSRASNLLRAGFSAAKSIAKTQVLRKDRTSEDEYRARLTVCENCPGDHATFKNGLIHTCGPMIKSMMDKKQKTCGCVLKKKARDKNEDCPFGYWPSDTE